MTNLSIWRRRAAAVAFAGVALALAACQPAQQNTALSGSSLKMENAELFPSDPPLKQGKVFFKNGQYGNAEAAFRQAVALEPKDTEAWLGLAASLDQLRRFDLADKAYAKVLVLGKNNVILLNNAGYSALLRGNTQQARRFLLRAYEVDPSNIYVQNNLALLGETGETIKRATL